jgi:hypothetical protein
MQRTDFVSFEIDLGANNDSLIVKETGVVAYALTGNTGSDTLVGLDTANGWDVTGVGTGTLDG